MALTNSYWHSLRPSFEEIREYLAYDPMTGRFTWAKAASKKVVIGARAGSMKPDGYRQIRFASKGYSEHSLAWLFVHGEMPKVIDHKNGDPSDNRICNLRLATISQNQMNRRPKVNGTSPYKGVTRITGTDRWMAHIRFQGKSYNLGHFTDQADAARAYDAKAQTMFGAYARLNFPQEANP